MKLNSLKEAKTAMKNRINETEFYFAIVLKDTGKVIGEIQAMHMKRLMLSLIIYSVRKVQDASMLIPKTAQPASLLKTWNAP